MSTAPPPRQFHGLPLDPFQERAIEAIDAERSLIVAAPTGAGKTLIAEYAIEKALKEKRPLIYTAPIKALSNQKYRDFSGTYGSDVGILTGDVSINPDATVLILTTEIYRNSLFESPERVERAGYVIFDEIHFLSDIERGTVWEESILFAPKTTRMLCLSATVPNLDELAQWMGEARGETVEVILEKHRPVPLKQFFYLKGHGPVDFQELKALGRNMKNIRHQRWNRHNRRPQEDTVIPMVVRNEHLPCLYFCFNRRRCEELAKHNRRLNLLTREEYAALAELIERLVARYGIEGTKEIEEIRPLLLRGIGYHHAGLLPTTKELVEQCFTTGLLKLMFATETFAMGVNMPARSVVFDSAVKFDGVEFDYIPCRDFQQMSGRAGRRGKDKVGFVYVTIDPRDMDAAHLRTMSRGAPEELTSQFNLSYASVLKLYERLGEGIFQTLGRSFGAALARRYGTEHDVLAQWERELRGRLKVLRELGYLDGQKLTFKGKMASVIGGREVLTCELYWNGFWNDLDPDQANVLAASVVTEQKRAIFQAVPPKATTPFRWKSIQFARELRQKEEAAGIRTLSPELCYDLAAATWSWSRGVPFDQLHHQTASDLGDLVRVFRQALQLLRQVREALPKEEPLRDTLTQAIAKLNRDEVDAEKQLRA